MVFMKATPNQQLPLAGGCVFPQDKAIATLVHSCAHSPAGITHPRASLSPGTGELSSPGPSGLRPADLHPQPFPGSSLDL